MDKPISELIEALSVGDEDLYVLEQDGEAKKLKWATFIKYALARLDGHGGIRSIEKTGTSGLLDTYTITLADDTAYDIAVKNGRGIQSISKTGSSGLADILTITYNDGTAGTFTVTNGRGITSFVKTGTEGLVDTYTITYNDGTSGTITVTNGAKGDKGDNTYTWIKYASQEPTEESHSMGDVPDAWRGEYNGNLATAPTDWKQYKWYKIKGEKGDTGDPATLVSSEVTYQVSDSGTILPSGEWSTTIPVVAQGKYLWTRTVKRFNTGDPVTAYTIARMGMDGLGSVSSVCGISPDAEGNVALTASDVGALADTGGDLTGELRMNGQPITGLNDPVGETDAARKRYVDGAVRKAAPRNLLDNSDFRNPVNQRGNDSYSVGQKVYTIDRWFNLGNDVMNLSIESDGVTIIGTENDKYIIFAQHLTSLPSGVYTAAVKTDSGVFCKTYSVDGTQKDYAAGSLGNGWLYNINAESSYPRFRIYTKAESAITLIWAALYEGEYTAETLPEYQPKGYGAELAECMRYNIGDIIYIELIQPTQFDRSIILPTQMRITHFTVTVKSINGNTGYLSAWDGYASAWVDYAVSTALPYGTQSVRITADVPGNCIVGFAVSANADL